MNTKTSLIILGVVVAIIAIIAITQSKKGDSVTEPKIDPVTGEPILGTGGPDATTDQGAVVPTDPNAPKNPTFPKTGFKPVK